MPELSRGWKSECGLKPFVRQGHLQVWADPYVKTGETWRATSTRRWRARAWRRAVHARGARAWLRQAGSTFSEDSAAPVVAAVSSLR